MSEVVEANDGVLLPLNEIPQVFEYDGTFLSTITVEYAGNIYKQTFTNDGTHITNISRWENIVFPLVALVDYLGRVMVDNTREVMVVS